MTDIQACPKDSCPHHTRFRARNATATVAIWMLLLPGPGRLQRVVETPAQHWSFGLATKPWRLLGTVLSNMQCNMHQTARISMHARALQHYSHVATLCFTARCLRGKTGWSTCWSKAQPHLHLSLIHATDEQPIRAHKPSYTAHNSPWMANIHLAGPVTWGPYMYR